MNTKLTFVVDQIINVHNQDGTDSAQLLNNSMFRSESEEFTLCLMMNH